LGKINNEQRWKRGTGKGEGIAGHSKGKVIKARKLQKLGS